MCVPFHLDLSNTLSRRFYEFDTAIGISFEKSVQDCKINERGRKREGRGEGERGRERERQTDREMGGREREKEREESGWM